MKIINPKLNIDYIKKTDGYIKIAIECDDVESYCIIINKMFNLSLSSIYFKNKPSCQILVLQLGYHKYIDKIYINSAPFYDKKYNDRLRKEVYAYYEASIFKKALLNDFIYHLKK